MLNTKLVGAPAPERVAERLWFNRPRNGNEFYF